MPYMTNQQKRDLDHWLTTPPDFPETDCPECGCKIYDAESRSEVLPGRDSNDEFFIYTCPDDDCGHKWVENG